MPKRTPFFILLVLSLIGALISLYLSHLHYLLTTGSPMTFKFCAKGCDAVNTSSYSELFGTPIASYGAIVYTVSFFLSFLGLFLLEASLGLFILSLLHLISLFCVLTSLVLAFISIFKLSSFCNLCGLTYLLNFLLFGVSAKGLGLPLRTSLKAAGGTIGKVFEGKDFKKYPEEYYKRIVMGFLILFVFVGGASGFSIAYFHSEKYRFFDRDKIQKFLDNYATLPRLSVQIQEAPSKGSKNPKLSLVVLSDFACSHCRTTSFLLERLLPEYRHELQIIYKHYPHDQACNPYESSFSPKNSCQLSKAALCAQRYGKFWEYHDLLFEPKEGVKSTELVSLAGKVGIDRRGFEECLADPGIQQRLLRDIEEAHRFNTRSTPTFFLNGKTIQGLPPLPVLHTLIQREIHESSRR